MKVNVELNRYDGVKIRNKLILALSALVITAVGFLYLFPTKEISEIDFQQIDSLLTSTFSPELINTNVKNSIDSGNIDEAKQYISLAKSLNVDFDKKLEIEIEDEDGVIKSTFRNTKNFGEGFIFGGADSTYAIAGSIASDFTVVGDIRDILIEANHYIKGEPVSKLTAGLSIIGIALTTSTVLSSGTTSPAKVSNSILKILVKGGKISNKLLLSLKKSASKAVDVDKLLLKVSEIKGIDNFNPVKWNDMIKSSSKHIDLTAFRKLTSNVSSIKDNVAGIGGVLKVIKYANDIKDIKLIAKLSNKYKKKTPLVVKHLGLKAIKLTKIISKKLIAFLLAIVSFIYFVLSWLFSVVIGRKVKKKLFGKNSKNLTLKKAYVHKKAPKGSGVYKILYKGKLMKVGKAGNGLRKRFSDYYRGKEGGTAGLKFITKENRDDVFVYWEECTAQTVRSREIEWYEIAKSKGETLPWSERK